MANEQGIVSPAYTILRYIKPIAFGFYKAYFRTNEFINHILSKSVEGIRDGKQISYDAFKWLAIILVLRLCLIFAYKEQIIPMLNWDLIEYPKDLRIKKVISLSKDEELALIQCIYMKMNRRTAGILVALFTGVRIGELCGLQMRDISLIDKTITIQRTVQRIYDKVKGTSYVYIGAPKTVSSARTIPLPSLLINIIKKYYTDNPNQYFLTGKNKPTEPRTYRQFFARFLKKHNLRSVKFHEIRHTFAVRAIEIPEFDVKSLSEILGHKNVSFTLNVYGRANMQQKIKCMNLLNELL